jgi:hypothetical protein
MKSKKKNSETFNVTTIMDTNSSTSKKPNKDSTFGERRNVLKGSDIERSYQVFSLSPQPSSVVSGAMKEIFEN